jgi:hypothetical protein
MEPATSTGCGSVESSPRALAADQSNTVGAKVRAKVLIKYVIVTVS